jgi:hypothetical protein
VSYVFDALHLYLLFEQVFHVQKQNQGRLPKQIVVAYALEEIQSLHLLEEHRRRRGRRRGRIKSMWIEECRLL